MHSEKMTHLSLALGRLVHGRLLLLAARRDESAVASNHCQRTEDDGGRLRVSERWDFEATVRLEIVLWMMN